ncbi:MAG: formylglycine-generating enzyme family protein, partial [Acidobacteriota bacterium]
DYLVKRLESNEDEYLRAGTLFERLQVPVINNSTTRQTPQYGVIPETEDEGGQFIFVRRGRSDAGEAVTTVAPAPTPTPDPEAEAWKVVAISTNVEVVRDFIKYFPGGRYIGAAQLKLKELETKASATVVETRKAKSMLTTTAFTAGTIVDGKLIRKQGECELYTEDLGDGVLLEMVRVPGGDFLMGEDEAGAAEYEKECAKWLDKTKCKEWAGQQMPQHRVRVKEFLLGRYEVTQRQWRAVMGGLPAGMEELGEKFKGEDKPVVSVSWEEVKECIRKLGKGYRLPSEAEWEYAARGGMKSAYGYGDEITPEIVNYNGNFPAGKTKKGVNREAPVLVGSMGIANQYGLYDMHGNVWEWCEDEAFVNYKGAPVDGSAWVSRAQAANRVIRGGSWYRSAVDCRSAYRFWYTPGIRSYAFGFRLSRTLP